MPFWIYFHRPYYQNIVPLRATIFYHKNLLLPYFLYFKKWSYQRHNIKISFLVQLFLLNAWLIMTLCLLIGCGKLFFSVLRGGLHVSKNLCHLNLLISARIYQAYRSHNKDEVARPSCKTSLQGIFFTAFLFNLNSCITCRLCIIFLRKYGPASYHFLREYGSDFYCCSLWLCFVSFF